MKTTPPPLSDTYPELSQTRIRELEQLLPEKPVGVGQPAANRAVWDRLAVTAEGKEVPIFKNGTWSF